MHSSAVSKYCELAIEIYQRVSPLALGSGSHLEAIVNWRPEASPRD
jgi:hypothetical protein